MTLYKSNDYHIHDAMQHLGLLINQIKLLIILGGNEMSAITYNDFKNSDNKLAILLYRLSYPPQESADYWDRWANQPLHEFILPIIKGLAEHRQRILRLHHEQDFIYEQYQQLQEVALVPEDKEKVQNFLHREYTNLLRAEKQELQSQVDFLDNHLNQIEQRIANVDAENDKRWQAFFKQQIKLISTELKKKGLHKEFQKIMKEDD